MRVHAVKDKTIVVDFNHPLAGKTLYFDLKITARAEINVVLPYLINLTSLSHRVRDS